MKARILGCGTSSGVPRIGNDWGRCDPAEPKNRRLRASMLLEQGGHRLLVDCGPDMRAQLLAADVAEIDAAIITHMHADHVHGIDDLRQLMHRRGSPVPVWARNDVHDQLAARFGYLVAGGGPYPPAATAVILDDDERAWAGGILRFTDQPHGGITSLGMTYTHGGVSLGYAIDFNDLTDGMASLYEGVDLWICDCLGYRPHPTHAHLDAVLGWARELGVGQLVLTHLDTVMDYATLCDALPDWAAPAYDGMELDP